MSTDLGQPALSPVRRVLMVTFGTHGDLHPYLAMGTALRDAGLSVTIATHPHFEPQVRRERLGFVALPPGPDDMAFDVAWARGINAPVRGLEYLVNHTLLPYFAEGEERLRQVAPGHDLIITHFTALFAPAVAESLGIPWWSTTLSPTGLFSAFDPPALAAFPFLPRLRIFGPDFMRTVYRYLETPSRKWFSVVHDQRARLGLDPLTTNPLFQYWSPHGNLILFPEWFAPPRPDWPLPHRQLSFPRYDADPAGGLNPATVDFLARGSAPIVFTLGTVVSLMRTDFFRVAHAAVQRLRRRAIFLVGSSDQGQRAAVDADPNVLVVAYENLPRLFEAAAVVVHHGGVNTVAQALASGRPQVCVPFANDQWENARRLRQLGAGVVVPARRMTARRLTRALRRAPEVLKNGGFTFADADFARELVDAVAGRPTGAN